MSQTARRPPQTTRRRLENAHLNLNPNPYPLLTSRLPRGPHSLSREQVAANQRMRIGMAMLEAIGEKGYVATTVSEVVTRAGVSRKAFYQHFTNKEECFLATYDAVVEEGMRRVSDMLSDGADRTNGVESTIRAMFLAGVENPHALRLAITEIAAVGPAGIDRRERTIAAYGQLIADGLAGAAETGARTGAGRGSDITLRAVVGGLNSVLTTSLRGGRAAKPLELVSDLARWASVYYPVPRSLTEMARVRPRHARENNGDITSDVRPLGGRAPGTLSPRLASDRRRSSHGASRSYVVHSQRERILDAVTNLTAANGYGALTVEDIASEAAISLQAFYEHFESKEDAFLVAYELGHARGLDIAERGFATAPDWRTGVREGLSSLLGYLASEPSFARLALIGTTVATPRASKLSDRGMSAYAQLLAPGFEEMPKSKRPPQIVVNAIAGGLHELLLHYAAHGRVHELPELAPDATYIALAPFIGPAEAARVATKSA
jgi:AcrR family transcriptional regulator